MKENKQEQYQSITVTGIREEVEDVKTFYFAEEDAQKISYRAGQYLTLIYPELQQEIRRSYSIISSPALGEPLAVGVKRIKNGLFSRYLTDQVQVGDKLLTKGAGGLFTLPEDLSPYKQLFFFAAGSGITPIFSLLKSLLHTSPTQKAVLIYSNSSTESTLFLEELQELEAEFSDRLKVEYLYSNARNLSRARLHRDLLKLLVREYAQAAPHELLCFICGPEIYMRTCLYGLRQLQVPLENIRREYFTTAKVMPAIKPPDTAPHQVRLIYEDREFALQVQYPSTILEAARKWGISVPFSCEVGRCGNCVAKCSAGKVWMSYNEVLTERDLQQGLVLTCVGYPVGGDVTLEF